MELWDVFGIINTGWLHHPAFKKWCVSCERGFADNLGEESQVAAPSRDSSATCLCLSLRNEERNLWALPGRNLSLDMLEWAPWGRAHHSHTRWLCTAKPQNAALGAGLQISVLCRFFRGHPPRCHLALLCRGWWLGWSLWGWHLQVRYHRVKSTMGKCLVDF